MTDDIPDSGDNDMADTATAIDPNSGGRVRFDLHSEVRYIETQGTISPGVYLIDQERSDRKGQVTLRERDGTRVIRVHHRRILPSDMEGKSVVVESQDKLWALCPNDGVPVEVSPGDTTMGCPKCSKSFNLHWTGVKPMAEATTKTEKKAAAPKADKAAKTAPKAPKAPREPKVTKEPTKVDISALAKTKGCELWTKKNVKFDHERIDVQAHVLLFTGESPRKLCFNTYNEALGKKAGELPIEQFVAGDAGKGKAPWFPVADLEKARAALQKGGYEMQK